MKIRNGFVSNSSSSSFIVIRKKDVDIPKTYKNFPIYVGITGEREFGWQIEKYYDFESKLNFCYMQAMYYRDSNNDDRYIKMIKDILIKNLKCSKVINELSFDYENPYLGYIDHQSSCPKNMEMFKSNTKLFDFLFSKDSYVRNCNDNE